MVYNYYGTSVWCTACDQEWYREAPLDERVPVAEERLRAERIDNMYWTQYETELPLMAPASQVIAGGIKAYVATAAIPRFVNAAGL